MADTRELIVRINGDASGFKNAMGDVEDRSKGVAGAMDRAKGASFALLGGLTAVAGGALFFGKASFDAYNESVAASTKLRTNLLNVKGATDEHVMSLEKLASQLQSVGVIEDDVIKAGMSQLATFNLQGKTIESLTPKITDMVAQLKGHNATAEDMVAINNLVGKVMTGNVGALSRYGVTLSENQAALLKQGTEAERAAVLNEVLAQNYGKVNEALRNTPEGKLTALKNSFDDIKESVGGLVANALQPVINALGNWFQKIEEGGGPMAYLKKVFEDNETVIYAVAGAIAVALIPAIVAMGTAIWTALAPILPFIAAGVALGLAVKAIVDAFGGWGPLWEKLKPTFDTLAGVWRDHIQPALMQVWDVIKNRLWPALKELWEQLEPILLPVLKFLAIVVGVTLYAAFMVIINVLRLVIGWISNLIGWFADAIRWVKNLISNIVDAFGSIVGHISRALSGVWDAITSPFKKAFDWIKDKVNDVKGFLNKLNPFNRDSPSLVDYVKSGTREITNQYGQMFGSISDMAAGANTDLRGSAVAMASPQTSSVVNTRNVQIDTIVFGSEGAVRSFFDELDNDRLLSQKGLSPNRGAV